MRKSLVALTLAALALVPFAASALAADPQTDGRIFELRTYTASPGKLADLNARFRNHTLALFKKHGIEVVGFWTPVAEPEASNTLVYIVTFPSLDAQQKAWAAFKSDPEWKKAKADSEIDGVLAQKVESTNLRPTDYSPLR